MKEKLEFPRIIEEVIYLVKFAVKKVQTRKDMKGKKIVGIPTFKMIPVHWTVLTRYSSNLIHFLH